ncbi:DsbA family protein [Microbacterium sp. P05]|uniref:DsbA family protein n=1 Tax=Microbacterium sp. P05 TaxID=3366948 RepID=UPI0037452D87
MPNDDPSNVPAKRDRREAVREKAQQVQTKQSRLRVLRRVLLGVAILVVVGVAAVSVSWAVTSATSRPVLQPDNADADGFLVTSVAGSADAGVAPNPDEATPTPGTESATPTPEPSPTTTAAPPVDIRVYVDYLSAGAREFQLANASQLTKWVEADTATLTYYPVAMLTAKSNGTKYSLRAASAAACVATYSPDTFFRFNHELLRAQPGIDSDGLTDEDLANLAIGSSAEDPDATRTCIEDESFAAWAKSATDRALKSIPGTDGMTLTGTPVVLVNGTPYVGALDDPKEFQQFVTAVASDAYYRTASPTPTPTATPTPTPTETATPSPTATP